DQRCVRSVDLEVALPDVSESLLRVIDAQEDDLLAALPAVQAAGLLDRLPGSERLVITGTEEHIDLLEGSQSGLGVRERLFPVVGVVVRLEDLDAWEVAQHL